MLFPFTLGYLAKKCNWFENFGKVIGRFSNRNILNIIILVIICIVRMMFSNYSIQPFFAILFILLFANIHIGKILGKLLTYLGKHSMNVWLIHTWICYRLFHDFVYDLYYPLLIFNFVLIISLVISHIIEFMYKPFKKVI